MARPIVFQGAALGPDYPLAFARHAQLERLFREPSVFDPKSEPSDLLRIEKLDRTHAVEPFTCGQPELDRFLARHALRAQQSNSSQAYLALSGSEVVGFYTIVAGEGASCERARAGL